MDSTNITLLHTLLGVNIGKNDILSTFKISKKKNFLTKKKLKLEWGGLGNDIFWQVDFLLSEIIEFIQTCNSDTNIIL